MEEERNEEHSLAWELLTELKESNQRLADNAKRNGRFWFAIALAELAVIIGMIIGFFVYESQYDYELEGNTETYTQETHDIDSSTVTQTIE